MITSCAPMPLMRSNMPSPARSTVPSTCTAGNLLGTTRTSQPGVFGHRFSRLAKRMAVARLDLDEHDRLPVATDDVDFSNAAAVAPDNNCVPAPLELRAGEIFTAFPKDHTRS